MSSTRHHGIMPASSDLGPRPATKVHHSSAVSAITPRVLAAGLGLLIGAACSGGGSRFVEPGSPTLLLISAGGLPAPLWQISGGAALPPNPCPAPVFLNGLITFTFGGAVDPASLPSGGVATGAITIVTNTGNASAPATGRFSVSDDPSLPAGNQRRVVFHPQPPADPNNPATAGLIPNAQYTIYVPTAGSGGPVLRVAGVALTTGALTCFATCDPATPDYPCLTDPVPGPAFVTATTPETGDPAPGEVNPATIGFRVSLFFSEPLLPAGISLDSVILRTSTGSRVPGSLVFHQAGSPEAGPNGARIDYVLLSPLIPNLEYELSLLAAVRDFGDQPVLLYAPNEPGAPASGRRFFRTIVRPTCPQPPIIETFDTTAHRGTLAGPVAWDGTGVLTATYPYEVLGNGAFGPLNFGAGAATLDPGMPTILNGGQVAFEHGAWNTTSIVIAAGATVRCTGHSTGNRWPLHLRCLGTVTISGTLDASAGGFGQAMLGTTEQGPQFGRPPGSVSWSAGGVGGSGGGRGGDASQADRVGPLQRTPSGETGHGPPINGEDNLGPVGANPHFGGGAGGQGGTIEAPGLGGLGGAGGSAFDSGADGGPNASTTPCTPVPAPAQARALATGQPAAFAPPVSLQSAGSGGGGGGDWFVGTDPGMDYGGGGGGGGGGGIRITALGDINVTSGASVSCAGAWGAGGASSAICGSGGGGSGGEIWLQSFAQLVINSAAAMGVAGGTTSVCGNPAAGPGGAGLYQLEDVDGVVNTGFSGVPAGGANVSVVAFPWTATIVATAVSGFLDSGGGSPDYTSVQETYSLGNVPVGAVSIAYQGAFEAPDGTPDPATLTSPVSGANIDALDGYRYVRFIATLSYAQPPAATITHVFPSIDQIAIYFRRAEGCP